VPKKEKLKLESDLKKSESELRSERQRLSQQEAQLADLKRDQGQHTADAQQAAQLKASLQDLQAAHQQQELEHRRELERHREQLHQNHSEELRLAQEKDEFLRRELASKFEMVQRDVQFDRETAAQVRQERAQLMAETAEAEAKRQREDAEATEKEAQHLREELGPLRVEYNQAARELQETRIALEGERAMRASAAAATSVDARRETSLEVRLAEARSECARSEQKFAELQVYVQRQKHDLEGEVQTRGEELQQRNGALQQRDRELRGVNFQLADLQGLFDDVNSQLQAECGRVEKLQATVQICAKQGKELETLQGMLEDSHRMLAQVRDALEHERSERLKTQGMFEHEQQRTRLLLDVLKHFKEKLQGLTPQMLLSRLGSADPKVLLGNLPFDPVALDAATAMAPFAAHATAPASNLGPPVSHGREHFQIPPTAAGPFDFLQHGLTSPRCEQSDGVGSVYSTTAPDTGSCAAAGGATATAGYHCGASSNYFDFPMIDVRGSDSRRSSNAGLGVARLPAQPALPSPRTAPHRLGPGGQQWSGAEPNTLYCGAAGGSAGRLVPAGGGP